MPSSRGGTSSIRHLLGFDSYQNTLSSGPFQELVCISDDRPRHFQAEMNGAHHAEAGQESPCKLLSHAVAPIRATSSQGS
jgi:hypothetical protein